MSDEQGDSSYAFIRRHSSKKSPARKTPPARTEFDFIDRVRQKALERLDARGPHPSLITHHPSLLQGIGDDAAVLSNPRADFDTVVTADLLVEDIDFRLPSTTPRLLGHKALAVSLSDVAAMGARPRWALLSVGAPARVWKGRFLDEFYEGFFALADAHGVALVGGDVSRTGGRSASSEDGPLVVDSIVLGEVRRGRAVLRSGARPGDQIYVTGALGGAAAGLRLLEEGKRVKRGASSNLESSTLELVPSQPDDAARRAISLAEVRQRLILRQLRPTPRVRLGQLLGERRLATSMIDLSDGLSSDLAHLCREGGVGALVDATSVPVDPHVTRALKLTSHHALELALDGGEDFELLFTVRPGNVSKLLRQLPEGSATRVGEVTGEAGGIRIVVDGRIRPLAARGFRHF